MRYLCTGLYTPLGDTTMMNDDYTNKPRDHTATSGDDFNRVKSVAESVIIELSLEPVLTIEQVSEIIWLVSRTYYTIGYKTGEADAYRDVAHRQIDATAKAQQQALNIVTANNAQINEEKH